jgi:[ribosomal protein S18]-alanine N-acetyltransferase
VSEAAEWRVQRADPSRVAEIHAIASVSFDAPWSPGAFEEEFRTGEAAIWIASDAAGAVHGYIVVRRALDEAHILSLATAPATRRSGVATALLTHALGVERASGARIAHLEVRAGNAEAIAFYARHGFREMGRRRRYYPDGTDALLLATALVAPRRAEAGR